MTSLYPHQCRFLADNPQHALLVWSTGCGKTLAATEWMTLRPHINFLVVCPKQVLKMWKEVVPPNARVLTKEQFKKDKLLEDTGIVVDEADHGFGSALFTKGRSAMATTLYNWIRAHDTAPVLLLSATVIRNAPHTSHTLLTYIQRAESWKDYRAKQYELISRPYQPRPFYSPVPKWQKYSAKIIRENASVVDLSDIVDVPEQFENVVYLYKK